MAIGARAARKSRAADGVQLYDPRWEPSLRVFFDPANLGPNGVDAPVNRALRANPPSFALGGVAPAWSAASLNGKPGITFAGLSKFTIASPGAFPAGRPLTIACAIHSTGPNCSGNAITIGKSGNGNPGLAIVLFAASATDPGFAGAALDTAVNGPEILHPAGVGATAYCVFASDGVTARLRVNGVEVATGDDTRADAIALDEIVIGAQTPEWDAIYMPNPLTDSVLGPVLAFSDTLSAYALGQLEAMLAVSCGL